MCGAPERLTPRSVRCYHNMDQKVQLLKPLNFRELRAT
jgi:hypothetical protein